MRGPLSESCLDNKPASTHRQGFILTSCPRVFPRKEISNPTGQIRAQWSARHCPMFGLVIRCCRTTPPSPSAQQLKPHLWSPEQCGLEAAAHQGLHGPLGPRCHLQQLGLTVHWVSPPTTWRIIHKKTSLASSHSHLRVVRRKEQKLQSLLRPWLPSSYDRRLLHCTGQSKSQGWPRCKGWRNKPHFLMRQVAKSCCTGRGCCEQRCKQSTVS